MTHARTHRILLAALAIALALAVWAGFAAAPPARANEQQISMMMDDNMLLYRGDATRRATLQRMRLLGVDAVRVTVAWSYVTGTTRIGRKFKGENPRSYNAAGWDPYDELVVAARQFGIGVLFNVTGPTPRPFLAKAPDPRDQRSWKPNARQFSKFVRAVGTRYSGVYRDENSGVVLPRVTAYSLWNEPNQGAWLSPQFDVDPTLKRQIAVSPILYRELYLYGYKGLEKSGHGNDQILAGETAPLPDPKGRRTVRKAMGPETFIREFFCVAPNGRPYRGRDAKARRCDLFKKLGPFRATGWAHHPYTKKDPPEKNPGRDAFTMANIRRFPGFLDRIANRTGRLAPRLPVWLTEYGYETNPPDPFQGVSTGQQAQFLNEGDYIAYYIPRIVAQTQFLLRDVEPVAGKPRNTLAYWFTYQSGLFDQNDEPKPAATAYGLPFVVRATSRAGSGGNVNVWGQLRFRPNSTQNDFVQIQFRPQGGTTWSDAGPPVPVRNPLGFFNVERSAPVSGSWRAVWKGSEFPFSYVSRESLVKF